MNILHVVSSANPKAGGVSRGLESLVKALNNIGIYNEIITTDEPGSDYMPGANCHELGPKQTSWQYSARMLPWLKDNVGRFDAVIVHGLWLYISYATKEAISYYKTRASGKHVPKLFIMPHGMLDPYFQSDKNRKLKALRNLIYWNLVEKNIINSADALLFTCETELLISRKTFNEYNPKSEFNIGFGIEPPPARSESMVAAFRKEYSGIKDSYFLFLSRIDRKKGVDLLIESYIALYIDAKKNLRTLPELVIAGPGLDTPFGKTILRLIESSPEVKKAIHFVGMLSGDIKWGAFYECEAFVLPSHQENFGIAVAEAMACNKGVLISDKINIWKEINNAQAGIVETNTYDGTYLMLQNWIAMNEEEKQRVGNNAYELYRNNFKIEAVAEKLIKVIDASRTSGNINSNY